MPTSSRAGLEFFHARLNGKRYVMIPLSHSTHRCNSVGLRDDVGIVPYNRDGPCAIQRGGAVSWGFGWAMFHVEQLF